MKVLSLFDGMSCGRIALDRLGIPVEKYYASEIDKYAIQVSQANYPDIIQVGDICDLDPKDYMDVDLMLAGSPCQGFSFAGKQLAFDDPRSALFFEFIRLLKEIKPKYFLLENVRMKKEFLQVISEQVSDCYPEIPFGIEPIFINSSLLSAQSRQRYYWTNIPNIQQPEDKGIVLRDILETEVDNNLDKMTSKEGKAHCLTASYTGAVPWNSIEKRQRTMVPVNKPIQVNPSKKASGKQPYIQDRVFHEDGKSHSLTASFADRTNVATRPIKVGMNVEQVKVRKHEVHVESLKWLLRTMKTNSGKTNKQIAEETNTPVTKVEHWFRNDNSFAIPSDDIWFKLKEVLGLNTDIFDAQIMEFEYRDGVYESKQRVYSEEGKSPTLTASNKDQYIETKPKQVGIAVDINGHDILKRVYSPDGKSPTVTACSGGNNEPKVVTGGAFRGRAYDKDGKRIDRDGSSVANKTKQMLELRKDNKSNAITTVGKDSVVASEDLTWRKLTPLECERLQTVPDNYTNHVSNTQRYKMLGNGWTVDVICHIFKNME
jgi:DNA-cytosine methyltransferase